MWWSWKSERYKIANKLYVDSCKYRKDGYIDWIGVI